MFRKSKKMHFIGIGGIGMSGIAEILINLGYDVSGSDLRESEQTKRLRQLGATIYIGHYPSNIKDYHVVVTSSAISKNNPEIIEAKKRKIPVIHRSEMLAELVRLKHGIGVAGTHGKTTTSSMLAYILYHGGLNPTAVVGGKVLNFGSNARIGEGQYFVFEADESDGSFLKLLPTIGIVTNIDADHLDHYKYFEGIKEAFITYMNNIPFYGYSVVCMDDPVVAEVLPRIERPYVTYGFNPGANFKATNIKLLNGSTRYSCYYNDKLLGEIVLNLLGKHNIINSLAVVAVALELGLTFGVIAEAIAQFQGVGRRLEKIGETNGIIVVDDYGHHPTEIRATLDALKQLGKRLIVVFQPHRYTRTQYLYDEFGQSFTMADELFLTEIYPAGEEPIEGVSSNLIQQSVKKHEGRDVVVIPHLDQVPDYISPIVREGDVIVTLGAGDIYKVGHAILSMLDKKGVVQ
ncbi:MAG TPA: UDP-N-acetylmuramate--L-alanine ligase [Spirochaetota bacterium]|nr:UDP-N-acetylmuramate--L-alanine ligase [Spirochaetota bacterium]HOM86968.1 UDP-N-acetylmuramate--L-alanine ligase [Spirochaetota bacterium]HOR93065.1 UDP-N-acetylmuramate--L-alanine ligase [Spirochaetota bacterium]HPD04496.1 UDP-N-acetylmuramate--L-alanine ligase [Spirochaetota bacterium]HPK43674.1 UDP-N-acetylmuramate--L-alanine ligase [Spirochaetota bacterium]